LVQYIPRFLEIYSQLSSISAQAQKLVGVMITNIGKIFVDISTSKVIDYVLSPPFLPSVEAYWNVLKLGPIGGDLY
jgi:hypothetical protein